jgi:hypothetical protein
VRTVIGATAGPDERDGGGTGGEVGMTHSLEVEVHLKSR